MFRLCRDSHRGLKCKFVIVDRPDYDAGLNSTSSPADDAATAIANAKLSEVKTATPINMPQIANLQCGNIALSGASGMFSASSLSSQPRLARKNIKLCRRWVAI